MGMNDNLLKLKYGKPLDMRTLDRGIEWRKDIAEDQRVLSSKFQKYLYVLDGCPICESGNCQTYVIVFGYRYDICGVCGHVFCATPPNEAMGQELYDSCSPLKSVQSKIYLCDDLFEKRKSSIAAPKVAFITEIYKEIKGEISGKWVDIGSGAGEILAAATDAGWEVMGIESDKEECQYSISKGLPVRKAYLSSENAREYLKEAQVVTLFNVLEHIVDPKTFLRVIFQSLDEGFVAFEVPRHPSLSSLSAELFPNMACRHIYPPDHLHIFSENSVDLLCINTECKVVGKWFFGQDFFDLICSAAASQGVGKNSVWSEVAKIAPSIQQVVDEKGLSDTVIVVVYKEKNE
jgi:SAM-dependent methyltransferase